MPISEDKKSRNNPKNKNPKTSNPITMDSEKDMHKPVRGLPNK
ncbi:hypothetical protein [Inconstantimicrobium mannanitabidum]|uniref:Uncharacterized protein n=1 Tax=Inconstantimicrobium mannanitabidum TaxID=1604901 RepID=A0ACB5RHQ0_9CLOT|nr:hypothetical protein [Clostridium sp. TW13]GKX68573.1 hypothetical protein rsdtw13_38310 [Clostridium sp. TW13]